MKASKFFLFSILILSISFLIYPTEEVLAVEITNGYRERTSCGSANSTTFQNYSSFNDPENLDMISGNEYLLIVHGTIGADGVNANVGFKIQRDSVDVEGGFLVFEPNVVTSGGCAGTDEPNTEFMFFYQFTGDGNDDFTLDFNNDIGNAVTHSGGSAEWLVIELDDLTTDQWKSNVVTSDETLGFAWDTPNDPTITFTPVNNNDDWLIMCTTSLNTGATNKQYQSRINEVTDAVQRSEASWEGEDSADDLYVQTIWDVVTIEDSSHQFDCEAQRTSGGGGTHQRVYGAIFMLNLDAFETDSFSYGASLAVPNTLGEVETLAHQPATTGDQFMMTQIQLSHATVGILDDFQFQTDGTTDPVNQDDDRDALYDTNDISYWNMMNFVSLDTTSHNLDVDLDDGTVEWTATDRFIVAWSMELAGGEAKTKDIDNPLTMTDDQRFDISIVIENPMTMTDDERFFVSIRLDNPITITDTTDVFRIIDDVEQDPLTLTDVQRYDISIVIENPMTVTDDERFDVSIRLDNPITVTDTVDTTHQMQNTEENPLTLTDEQHYDISIRLDNPMTLTDDQRFDISIRIEDPMTVTDDERFDVSIRLDNPMTMTDDMNMIDRTQFAKLENPLTLTDEQRYDISIIIENPMTVTDDERFDTSIRLDNPITITDDVTPTKFLNALEQDPMTLTDDQRFDISIIIENPLTLTDEQHYDITVTPEDPMTMTDVTTFVRTINDVEENPMTITDVQRYDISIIIENPMTVTDDERFDTSIRLDNPMTITDDMNMIDLTRFDTEEDPITMTDTIQLDTSIIIENPMTMTDEQHYDITVTPEDPITMTDTIQLDTSIIIENPMTMTDIMTPDHTEAGGVDNFETIENPMTWTEVLTLLCTGICVPPAPPSGGGDPTPIDPDSDGDGIVDSADACPLVFGTGADGCPVPVIDIPEEPLPLQPLDFTVPFDFNELDVVDDYITLETELPQPQVEDLALRWLGDDQITITSINIGESPFEIQIQNIPITFGSVDFGFTQTQLIYTVQEPDKICGDVFSFDCLDEVTYEIPVVVTGVVDGKTIIADGSITIDNSGRTNPYWLALFGLLAVPILALLFWRRRKRLPKQNFTVLRKRTLKETAKAKPQKSGTARKLLKVTSKSRISGKTKSGSTRNLLRDTPQ